MPPELTAGPTIVRIARERAATTPERPAYVFLDDGETESDRCGFAELDVRARAIAATLQEQRLAGERVLIAYPSGLAYVQAFMGCLYAGVVAVPCDSPRAAGSRNRLATIRANCGPAAVLTDVAEGKAGPVPEDLAGLRLIDVRAVPDESAGGWTDPDPGAGDLAFLQYTSGSTLTPRGVMVSHGNIIANERLIAVACGHDDGSTFVGWQPLFHDMGLVANIMQPLYAGSLSVLMPPGAFLQRPVRWLRAVSSYRAHTSGGPNFAYDMCVAKSTEEERAGLDLRSWRVAFNAAEPVRAATLRRFTEAFAPYGFADAVHFPCYGLAEATLLVTGPSTEESPRIRHADPAALRAGRVTAAAPDSATPLVSCGGAGFDTEMRIVDPHTGRPCPDAEVGEIWVAGGGVADGYWESPAASVATFGARLDELPGRRFMRTGDLGCLIDNELYVTGRRKDMIVLRGQNHYAQDLELAAEQAHDAIRPTGTAAFGIDVDGVERVVLCCELRSYGGIPDLPDIAAKVYARILRHHGVELHALVVLRRGGVPKTTSGKVRRTDCREAYVAGRLPVYGEVALDRMNPLPALPVAAELRGLGRGPGGARLADALLDAVAGRLEDARRQDALDRARPLVELGAGSLVAMELCHAIRRAYAVDVGLATLLGDRTVADVAGDVVAELLSNPDSVVTGATGTDPVSSPAGSGWLPLTDGQHAVWFEQQLAPDSGAYQLARAVVLRGAVSEARLAAAIERLVRRHPALRTRFSAGNGNPRCRIDPAGPELHWVDAAIDGHEEFTERLDAEARRPADPAAGPAVRFTAFRRGPDERVLLVVANHLVTDFWSLVVLLRDLAGEYTVLGGGDPGPVRPAAGQPELIEAERRAATSAGHARARGYWQGVLEGVPAELDLPIDFERPAVRGFAGATHRFGLPAGLTARLSAFAGSHRCTLFTVLLAAYQTVLHRGTGQADFAVGTPLAVRDGPDLADAVGYLVNLVPIRSRYRGEEPFPAFLSRTTRAVLGAVEHGGYPYREIIADLGADRSAARSPLVQTTFVLQREYGAGEEGFRALALDIPARLTIGELRMEVLPLRRAWSVFELSLSMAEVAGELVGVWEYRPDLFAPETIASLTADLSGLLAAVVDHPAVPLDLLAAPAARRTPRPAESRSPDHPPATVDDATVDADTERRLARLWSAHLNLPEVGVEDNFFALGGDSIVGLRLVGAAQEAGLPVGIIDLLRYPTVRALAARLSRPADPIDTQRVGPFALCPEAAGRADLVDAYPISMGQRAFLFHREHNPGYEVYATSIAVRAALDRPALEAAVCRAMERHPYLRSSFDLVSYAEPMQLVHAGMPAAFEVVDLRELPEPDRQPAVDRWLDAERRRPFDTATGPLVRFTAHDADTYFRLTVSSFGLDGWSDTTLVAEVLSDYAVRLRGATATIASPRSDYRAFVAAERAAMGSAGHRLFWQDELADARPAIVPRWPAHPVRPAGRGDAAQRRRVIAIPDPIAAGLRSAATRLAVGAKHVLLAAHLWTVGALTGQGEVVTGLMANGRLEHADGDRTIGLFNNALALRVDVGAGNWADLVRSAHDAELRVTPYRRYPLVEAQRRLGAARLFNTLFVYTHFHLYEQLLGGAGLAVFDLVAPDQTYLPLTAHFNVDAWTGRLHLLLDFDPREFAPSQIAVIGEGYLRALGALAEDPAADHSAIATADLFPAPPSASGARGAAPVFAADERMHALIARVEGLSEEEAAGLLLSPGHDAESTLAGGNR